MYKTFAVILTVFTLIMWLSAYLLFLAIGYPLECLHRKYVQLRYKIVYKYGPK